MQQLRLSTNQFLGTKPKQLGQLTDLTVLQLDHNLFTRTIPMELGQLTKLTDMAVYHYPLCYSTKTKEAY